MQEYTACRAILDYRSIVKLAVLLGLCAGTFSLPFLFILDAGVSVFGALNVLFGAPVAGAGCGLLMGVLGYPLYAWFSSRCGGQQFSGLFKVTATGDDT